MDAADIQRRIRAHFIAFIAILGMSLLAAASVYFERLSLPGVLAIAAVQVLIIANRMMHVYKEGPWVRGVFLFAILSVVGFIATIMVGQRSTIDGTEHTETAVVAEPTEEAH
jgi:heme/copper-type cytochrome/quinol oxidase subunit 4